MLGAKQMWSVTCYLLYLIRHLLYVICNILYVIDFILGKQVLQCYILYFMCCICYMFLWVGYDCWWCCMPILPSSALFSGSPCVCLVQSAFHKTSNFYSTWPAALVERILHPIATWSPCRCRWYYCSLWSRWSMEWTLTTVYGYWIFANWISCLTMKHGRAMSSSGQHMHTSAGTTSLWSQAIAASIGLGSTQSISTTLITLRTCLTSYTIPSSAITGRRRK